MAGQVYFGTKAHMQWVPAPAVNMGSGKGGYAARADFLTGGTWVRRSKTGSKTYNMSWNLSRREEIQPILDYADGMYGDGPVYFLDPFASDRNALPAYWAAPYMNAYDGPVLAGDVRPTLVDNGSSTNGFPMESATYTLGPGLATPSIFVPIPQTYVAHVGVFGEQLSGTAGVSVTAHTTTAGGPTTDLTLMERTNTARTNSSLSGSLYKGLTLELTGEGRLRLDGLMVQVLPAGRVVPSGGFISGQGSSGMSFVMQPVVSAYSAALDRVGVSAELVETEAWV